MITNIITNIHFLYFPVLCQLDKNVFPEQIEVLLQLLFGHAGYAIMRRILVEIRQQNRLRKVWLDMLPRTALSVATCADFEIKRTVDFVLFCTVDGGQVIYFECKWLVWI